MDYFSIAYIAYYDFSFDTAATEHIAQIVSGLAKKGHKIQIFAPNFGRREFLKNVEKVVIPSGNVIVFDMGVAKAVDRISSKFDAVYLRDYMCASKIVKSAKKAKLPLVIEHNGLMHAETPLMNSTVKNIMLWFDDHFRLRKRLQAASMNIVVTKAIGEFFAERFGVAKEKFIHIPNGADVDKFKPATDKTALRKELGLIPPDAFYLGYIGSMFPWHMFDVIIEAFELLAKNRDDVRLFIAGKGPELSKVEMLANKSSAQKFITIKSPLPIEESHRYISALDVSIALMSPSVAPYCWQVKVNHAGASGVPSIITNDDQFRQLFNAEVAVAPKRLHPDDIAKTMEELLDVEKLRNMNIKMRKFVVDNLSWGKIVDETEKVINLSIRRNKIGTN